MKASEIFELVGNKLVDHYTDFGFKYAKKWGVKKTTNEYDYVIDFHSSDGNTKNKISLFVNFYVNWKNKTKNSFQLFHIDLWHLGKYYMIGESHTLDEVFDDICKHANILLIPFIEKFENEENEHLKDWISEGFLSKIPRNLYRYPSLESPIVDYTTHKHYWIGSEFSKNYNEFGFTISLPFIFEKFGRDMAEKSLNNYFLSLNNEAKKHFLLAFESEKLDEPWSCEYNNYPDVEIIRYSVQQNLKLKQ